MPFSNFAKYPNNFFIETGSYRGDGIQAALDSGFPYITSIEITPKYYNICKQRFAGNSRVHQILGDTADRLWDVIKDINEPITFWLDGHWDTGAIDETRGIMDYPILTELEIIALHPVKNHTILIDDIRLLNDRDWNIKLEDVTRRILNINPDYTITYDDGLAGRINDVLVAKV